MLSCTARGLTVLGPWVRNAGTALCQTGRFHRSDSDSYGMPRSESEHKRSESEHKRSESEQDYARSLVRAQLSVALRQ